MWYYLIFLLVFCPHELPVPHQAPEPLWEALKRVAWELELTGPRCPWITDFRSEVQWVRLHYREAASYPPLTDCQRLPPAAVIRQGLAFNRSCQQYLEGRWQVRAYERDEIDEVLRRCQQLGQVWEAMATASADDLNWFCRRQALARLRELVGDQVYYSGDWPLPAPVGGQP